MPIEIISPDLERVVSPDAPITELGDGFGGAMGPAEGPLWWHEGGYLLFSDIHNSRADEVDGRRGCQPVPGAHQPG